MVKTNASALLRQSFKLCFLKVSVNVGSQYRSIDKFVTSKSKKITHSLIEIERLKNIQF